MRCWYALFSCGILFLSFLPPSASAEETRPPRQPGALCLALDAASRSSADETNAGLRFLLSYLEHFRPEGPWEEEGIRRYLTASRQFISTELEIIAAQLSEARSSGTRSVASDAAHDRRNVLLPLVNLLIAIETMLPSEGAFRPTPGLVAEVGRLRGVANAMIAGEAEVQISAWGDLLRTLGGRTTTRFQLTFEPGIDATGNSVQINQQQMQEVFANLFSNATQARPNGPIDVVVSRVEGASPPPEPEAGRRFGTPAADKAYFAFTVTDQAGGIPAHIMARLGDVGNTTTGTGRGIPSIIRRVTQAGGFVDVVNVGEPAGTRFRVYLPAHAIASAAPVAPPVERAGPARYRVLIVDDNTDARRSLGTLFGLLGDAATRPTLADFPSGAAAIPEVRGNEPQVVLLDVNIGNERVLATAQSIRARNPNARILICSGYSRQEVLRNNPGLEPLISGFFQKPMDAFETHAEVLRLLAAPR